MERVAVPAHTRPKYQLASWCKRRGWVGIGWACAEWTPIKGGGDKVIELAELAGLFSDLGLHDALLTACWLLLLLNNQPRVCEP